MTTVTSRVLKDKLSSYLARAEGGEQFVVLRDGKPVAAVVPVSQVSGEGRFERMRGLAAEGLVELPGGPKGPFRTAERLPSRGELTSEMILEDRR